ncbi:MAG: adenylyl-sulfate reductase subunit beta [Bacillota bacterium]|jgi:adenylylsulfate reductase subunit B
MPSFVITEKCDGCKGQDKTACMYICPNDLMVLDKEKMKAFNRDPSGCWECYCCIKICPQQAMDCRGYADFVPMGASATALRGSEDIMWTIKFRNGMLKRFKFPIRTTPEGSAVPDGGYATDALAEDLKSHVLYTEPASLHLDAVPTLKK